MIGKRTLRHVDLVMLWAIGLGGQGCSFLQADLDASTKEGRERGVSKRIEIERDDPEKDLPCNVVYRPDSGIREVIWRARYEEGFCQRKADESRSLLESQGWVCRVDRPDNRSRPYKPDRGQTVVKAWHCEQGVEPVIAERASQPPIPTARPEGASSRPDRLGDPTLWTVVEKDLAAIGRPIDGPSTTATAAEGDLDDDGKSDAVVILTRKLDRQRSDRMVMAYLRHNQTYNLVDVHLSLVDQEPKADDLAVDIENGVVRLSNCCDDAAEPTTFILRDRKLTNRDNIDRPS